jgi:acylphosphatase
MATKRVHVLISGMVQGVFFRVECASRARQRGLAGFVRNLPDGRVEAAFEGSEDAVDSMVEWCHHGPRYAEVDSVQTEDQSPTGDMEFRIAH